MKIGYQVICLLLCVAAGGVAGWFLFKGMDDARNACTDKGGTMYSDGCYKVTKEKIK